MSINVWQDGSSFWWRCTWYLVELRSKLAASQIRVFYRILIALSQARLEWVKLKVVCSRYTSAESTHHRGKDHYMASLLFDWIGFSSLSRHILRVTSKKSPNVYKSCPKMITIAKWKILTTLQKLLKNGGDLAKIVVATGFEKLPKVQ